ncbi:hypothetical protein BN2475_310109 [Paraburkholderia ribeironis]|uniref:Uncharacterized protein n=1 Tax=Paraburkholderia ribeironis TaxID=1247936 RepID=A0A1N7S2M6_9BURK|nr:hypothetical protein BN2475_310109 [Paraburkholderia ribeironis]
MHVQANLGQLNQGLYRDTQGACMKGAGHDGAGRMEEDAIRPVCFSWQSWIAHPLTKSAIESNFYAGTRDSSSNIVRSLTDYADIAMAPATNARVGINSANKYFKETRHGTARHWSSGTSCRYTPAHRAPAPLDRVTHETGPSTPAGVGRRVACGIRCWTLRGAPDERCRKHVPADHRSGWSSGTSGRRCTGLVQEPGAKRQGHPAARQEPPTA